MNIRFIFRRSRSKFKELKDTGTLYFTINIDSHVSDEKSTGIKLNYVDWCSRSQKILNDDVLDFELLNIRRSYLLAKQCLEKEGKAVTIYSVIAEVEKNKDVEAVKHLDLLELISDLIDSLKKMKVTSGTLENQKKFKNNLHSYLASINKIHLMPEQFTAKRFIDYEGYLLERDFSKNYVGKNLQFVKRLLRIAEDRKQMSRNENELRDLKIKWKKSGIPNALDDNERQALIDTELPERFRRVADAFLFCIETGLAYADYHHLSEKHLLIVDGKTWIVKSRSKTDEPATIPLSELAIQIVEKYGSVAKLPRLANSYFNTCLKEVAVRCGIKRRLHHHAARKTFATNFMENGGAELVLASLMGWTSTREARKYVRISKELIKKQIHNK